MNEPVFALAGDGSMARCAAGTACRLLRTDADVRSAYQQHRRSLWVSRDGARLVSLVGTSLRGRRTQRLIVLAPLEPARRQLLEALFDRVVVRSPSLALLSNEELWEVLLSGERQDRLIGGSVDRAAQAIVLMRGNLLPLIAPFNWFRPRRRGPRPDFRDFEIIDDGQTIRLGEYEAAADALLYEVDADYRKRARARELECDDSFGGSLRRLRLLRGLKRTDFEGITAKEVARIERGEVARPHQRTLELLADRLGVSPRALATY